MVLTAPGQTIGVSVFTDHLIEDLSLSRSQVSTSYLVGTLLGATTLPVVGRWIDRHGVRRMLTVIGLAFGLALVATSGVTGMITLGLAFTGIRMLGQGSLGLVSQTATALWFDRKRGFAIALQMTLSAGLMSLAPLVLQRSISTFGWRGAWVASGIAIWLTVVPIARFVMVDRPSSIGQVPDGASIEIEGVIPVSRPSSTVAEAIRTPAFWSVGAMTALTSALITGLTFHHISIMTSNGLSEAQAAAMFFPMTIGTVTFGFGYGWLTDRVSARLLVPTAGLSLVAGLLMATMIRPGPLVIGYALLIGANAGAVRALSAALYPKWFGTAHIGAIRGVATVLGVGSSAIGPLIISVGNDMTGSYDTIFVLAAVVAAAVTLLTVTVADPA